MAVPSECNLMMKGFTKKGAKQAIKTMKKRVAVGQSPGGPSKFVKSTGKVKKAPASLKKVNTF